MHVGRSILINSIAVSAGLLLFIEGSKLFNKNDIIILDHQACVLGINFEEYFNEQLSE